MGLFDSVYIPCPRNCHERCLYHTAGGGCPRILYEDRIVVLENALAEAETEREELRIMRDNDILSRDRTIEDLRRRAEQAKWKALADERWELAACHLDGCRRRDEELEALSDRLDERDAQLAALEDEVERADAEIKRLNDICDRLAAAGRSHD